VPDSPSGKLPDVTVAATDGAEHAPFTAGWETVKALSLLHYQWVGLLLPTPFRPTTCRHYTAPTGVFTSGAWRVTSKSVPAGQAPGIVVGVGVGFVVGVGVGFVVGVGVGFVVGVGVGFVVGVGVGFVVGITVGVCVC
jgi:hypothetical protein